MKRLLAFLLLIFAPNICLADACTNPSEYKIDKRCYISDTTWQNKPYKHILKMYDNDANIVFCTANMVAGKIITARHCVENKDINKINFIAATGTRISVQHLHIETDSSDYVPMSQDWVILTPTSEFQNFVKENSIYNVQDISGFSGGSFIVMGYGGLKILKDKEISDLKKAYLEYLGTTDFADSLLKDDDSIEINTKIVGFKDGITPYLHKYGFVSAEDVFMDTNNMKLSVCSNVGTFSDIDMILGNCQTWGGNSGGGLYGIRTLKTKANVIQNDLCNDYKDCGFCGVFTISRSFISTDPSVHASKKFFAVPITEIKQTLENSKNR